MPKNRDKFLLSFTYATAILIGIAFLIASFAYYPQSKTYKVGINATIENITLAKMSYKDFVYTVSGTIFKHYNQKYPIVKANLTEVLKIASKEGILYYDDYHLFVPTKADHNATVVYVWEAPYQIIKIDIKNNNLIVETYRL